MKNKKHLLSSFVAAGLTILLTVTFPQHSLGNTNESNSFGSVEERRLQEQLDSKPQETKADIDNLLRRQNDLKILEESVDRKLAEVEKKIAELKKIKAAIEALVDQKDAVELQRLKQLAKIYESMATDKAARAITGLDRQLATDLLTAMKTKVVAKILAEMPQSVAIDLTTRVSATQLE